ncbi:hypothetical protein A3A95_03940 [Candidatus Nomurabacteria bacterium RIFCSPLOWO2_01_FULL_39_18]|uniref:MobA-like NTP transferase domain-containing protein n=1 Tax=Candidatus Nomurabacteria bacterium RIFCSPHIGHO2_01_FULL_40_24b TaxID=1801739 RepID=A0A1F6V624_9BACT|nr:MAG: hypothetical protein A2647_04580 [Candidatus Nomurabacteria bacterium RIFCSPHIGHO2_01_FULL_40_24b]OGI89257.1 MAG: hypothetical protein A3A95_03940 [Candidatus Nomurabacteria bacterium RIFCSPLOWO2_01_FULL_39_18]
MKGKIQVVILAAGHGKRMQSELPKVLIPLHGKPLVAHVLDAVRESGICNRPVVIVGQQRELVMQTLGSDYEYIVQEEQLGTGHAVRSTKKILEEKADHVMVLYGDHPFISPETIKKLAEKHLQSDAKITMAIVKLIDFLEWKSIFYTNFGRVVRNSNGEISKIIEFKDTSNDDERKIKEVNPSYFCFESKWLWKNLEKLKTDNVQKEYYLTDLVKIAMQDKEKIESVDIDPQEALGVNSRAELEILEKLGA